MPDAHDFAGDFADMTAETDAPPLLYAVTVATLHNLAGGDHTTASIGIRVWERLTRTERSTALPQLLEAYVSRVAFEETELSHQEHAERIAQTDGCLEEGDLTEAWDAVTCRYTLAPAEHEAVIDRDTLVRLLDEITVLRRHAAPTEAAQ